jgi:hypothetical protein
MPAISSSLDGMKVAILVSDGFEQIEMTEPRKALDAAGAQTQIVSPLDGSVRGWKHLDPADTFEVDVMLKNANADDFDALLLPGGVVNPDALRINEKAVAFVRAFRRSGQARCRNLPRPVDAHRRRWGQRTQDDVVAFAARRLAERRRKVDRPGSCD